MTSLPPKADVQSNGQSGVSSPSSATANQATTTSSSSRSSYASATKKSATDSTAAPVTVGGSSHHGKSSAPSPVSGQPMQQSQSPGVTIVNGAPAASASSPSVPANSSQPDHARKPSVTITSAGTSGYIPNGGPSSRPNSLQFGFANQQTSPNLGAPAALSGPPQSGLGVAATANPRITSPQTSPSPIPQPASSGGRPPPSSYQSQGNVPNFGSFGEAGDNMRPSSQAPLGPGPQSTHLRRESSQSTHSDMSNHMGSGPGRGGYPHQGGRGRGYSQSGYQGQMPYSPGPNFRSPNQPRGGPNMGPQFHGPNQGRPMGPFPNSPHQANRSPALANAHPATTPQMNQVPMAHPQMPPQPYGYGQHMAPQTNYPYDAGYGYYPPNNYGMQFMTPPSPQPRPGIPYPAQPGFVQGQYPVPAGPPQATPLSRTPSQVSNDRPGSSLGGQGPPPPVGPAGPGHAHSGSRAGNSPNPTAKNFVIPPAKRSPIVIRDPGTGSVKSFEKPPASPARATPSPVKIATPTATPPPRADHARTDSKALKTDEEKKQELKDAVRQKIEQDEADQRRQAEEAAAATAAAAKPTEAPKAAPAPTEEEKARQGLEDLSLKEKEAEKPEEKKEEEEEKKKEEPAAAAPAPAPAPAAAPADDDEIDYDAIEREIAEMEAKEAEIERKYNEDKQRKKEEADRKEKEELENYEANMKKAEREAEAVEEARERKRLGLPTEGDAAAKGTSPKPASAADAMGPPDKPASAAAAKPKPAALKLETKPVEPPQPSAAMKALQSARFLRDLSQVTYPDSIVSPNPALNASAPTERKFHYNKEFLLQFQSVFKDKPSIDWDARVRETVGDSDAASRPQSARTPMGSRSGSRTGGLPGAPQMGHFGMGPSRSSMGPGTPSDIRLQNVARAASMGGNPFGQFHNMRMGGPSLSRTNSSNAMGMPPSPRVGSGPRSNTRNTSKREKNHHRKEEELAKSMPLTAGMDVGALQVSSSGWKPRSLVQSAAAGPAPGSTHLPPDVVQRKVKGALNKMTPENFPRISGQILEIVSQSKDETDGRTLRQVIQLTFEKATDEAHWASIYAKFCKSMLESMSPDIKDDNIHDKAGNVVAGGSLFRKYLLNRCQEEFERGWKVNLPPKPEGETEEAAMMSDEYYKAAAAKRRGLGLVKFIGELYKLGMLTERIMHECVKKLVDYEGMPDEAEVESLTSLLRTIGASLDVSERGHAMMDVYFQRIKMMVQTEGLPSRMRFMILDIIDLRAANWRSKDSDKGPKTIHEIREEAARAQQQAEMERMRQQQNNRGGGRMAMGRGDARNFGGYGHQAPPPDYASSKVGSDDLRRLRTARNTSQPMSFGPSSMLGSRSNSRRNLGPGGNLVRGSDDSGASSRTGTPPAGKKEDKEAASSMNAFSALASLQDHDSLATSPPSAHTSPMLSKSQPAVERRPSKTPSKDGTDAS
ncbi:hypothetical protein P168DRAFT_83405 [Aspergillus campestris IBT 28561]|uniref:MIF4G domain-containing protein n=1 Tax=Aspergillus campestris (strain IBT 28561) TaxID=1392248 RepID=A0A2I1CQF8_ASPC2|nr:uncharacterized protein P168DRAFT_83405 [Aspergillus campestris IBT 28561]PKX99859.1 hypothetical protein P168DRAFT_83405 [Aspergillus campestris IBT 28561]